MLTEIEACAVDCEMDWQPWGLCNKATGLKSRSDAESVSAKNNGKACPPSKTESTECPVDCEMEFPAWESVTCDKATHKRTRAQVVKFAKKNDGAECSPLPDETDDCDVDCELHYLPWGQNNEVCNPQTGLMARSQVQKYAQFGNGAACPAPLTDYKACPVDCVVTLGNWTACNKETWTQTRSEYILVGVKNNGAACPSLKTESRSCGNCEPKFPNWNSAVHVCNKVTGLRSRTEIVDAPKRTKTCAATPAIDTIACAVDCELAWPKWDDAVHVCNKLTGLRKRTQVPSVLAKNGGRSCPIAQIETQACV